MNSEEEETGFQNQPNPKSIQQEETGSQNQPNPKSIQQEETGSQNQPNSRLTQEEIEKLPNIVLALNQKSKHIINQTALVLEKSSLDSSSIEYLSATAKDCDEIAELLANIIQHDM